MTDGSAGHGRGFKIVKGESMMREGMMGSLMALRARARPAFADTCV